MVRYKRGMSPLIATVLLMAFAVALGGMIMNWTASPGTLDCSDVRVEAIQFCYDQQSITLHARNVGNDIIEELSLRIVNPATGEFTVAIPNSRLAKGASVRSDIPVLVDDETSVAIIPSISTTSEAATQCPEPVLEKRPLARC